MNKTKTSDPVFSLVDLVDAFKAGVRHGEATQSAYDWGCGSGSSEVGELGDAISDAFERQGREISYAESQVYAEEAIEKWKNQ